MNLGRIAKILAFSKDEYKYDKDKWLDYIMVSNGVASVTDKGILVRWRVEAANGLYKPSFRGVPAAFHLSPASADADVFFSFPNLDVVAPPFHAMRPVGEFDKNTLNSLNELNTSVLRLERKDYDTPSVVLHGDTAFVNGKPETTIKLPMMLTSQMLIQSRYLEVAIEILMDYPQVYLWREVSDNQSWSETRPLIFGYDWSNCILIMPKKRYY